MTTKNTQPISVNLPTGAVTGASSKISDNTIISIAAPIAYLADVENSDFNVIELGGHLFGVGAEGSVTHDPNTNRTTFSVSGGVIANGELSLTIEWDWANSKIVNADTNGYISTSTGASVGLMGFGIGADIEAKYDEGEFNAQASIDVLFSGLTHVIYKGSIDPNSSSIPENTPDWVDDALAENQQPPTQEFENKLTQAQQLQKQQHPDETLGAIDEIKQSLEARVYDTNGFDQWGYRVKRLKAKLLCQKFPKLPTALFLLLPLARLLEPTSKNAHLRILNYFLTQHLAFNHCIRGY